MNVGIDEHRTKRKLKGKLTNENYFKNTFKKNKKRKLANESVHILYETSCLSTACLVFNHSFKVYLNRVNCH